MRSYVDTFHMNELNLPAYVLPSAAIATFSIDHLWHKSNCPRRSYVVSPALSDHYAIAHTIGNL